MATLKSAPERGWPRVGYFLARARAPKSARQAASETGASLRTIQAYERAEIDYGNIPPLMANYAHKIAGWTEQDIAAIYDGADPPTPEPSATGAMSSTGSLVAGSPLTDAQREATIAIVKASTELSEETKKRAIDWLRARPAADDASDAAG